MKKNECFEKNMMVHPNRDISVDAVWPLTAFQFRK